MVLWVQQAMGLLQNIDASKALFFLIFIKILYLHPDNINSYQALGSLIGRQYVFIKSVGFVVFFLNIYQCSVVTS